MRITAKRKSGSSYSFYPNVFLIICLISNPIWSFGQARDSLPPARSLKKLSLEELMDIEVTSVSRHPEKLDATASAIQVITREDIRKSGAKTLPEALRLAPNLQVAQVNSSQWAISARGFDNVLANKLLVLIDGRTVYTPLYAGVYWDVQNLLLEDVDRIEVISGPGGTLWGANAVNGVINIITKSARDTKGLFVEGATGSALPALGSLRYGGQLSDKLSYRVYGTGFKMGHTLLANDSSAKDQWPMIQGGFRSDWDASKTDKLSLQFNIYDSKPNPGGADTTVRANGDNIVARWDHKGSERSDFQLQAYYDHTLRNFGNGFTEDLKTYDIDWQNRYQLGQRHVLIYGLDFRLMDHNVTNLQLFKFLPGHKTLYLYSTFVQDEMMLVKERLRLTVGSKIEHNSYTGFEYQPNARLTWMPAKTQTVWAAVSRAVRTPARIDRDFYLYLIPNLPLISGNDSFKSENVLAYELGWRLRPVNTLEISLATFYNVYDNIRSAEPGPPPYGIPIIFGNGVKGKTYGIELSATCQLTGWWSLRGGYTFLKKDLSLKPGSKDLNAATAESDDPEQQFLIQSTMDLPGRIELGTLLRYVDKLPKPYVPGYTGLDVRIGWKLSKVLELDLVGQDLLNSPHPEFVPSSPAPSIIEHSIYGKIVCRL
jgi:iron complex outermembrane receptor protein